MLNESGEITAENDDIDRNNLNYNSRITRTLDAGDYTIEATTFDEFATGDFTLTVTGIGHLDDRTTLTALYHATDGNNWTRSDNWLTGAPLSEWRGVTTDDDGRVTEIYLIGNNLSGEIPAALGKLSHLEGLYLARNDLSGSILTELGDLSNLRTLMLFDNDLTGTIPYQLGNLGNLEEIHLGRNQLSGRIPHSSAIWKTCAGSTSPSTT